MSYFKDLTPFEYGPHECPAGAEVVNVGWLGCRVETEGSTPVGFFAKLKHLVDTTLNTRYRGMHCCEICNKVPGPANGQIQVQGEGNRWYVAPAMIAHYVADHNYRPPQEFIDAVMKEKA